MLVVHACWHGGQLKIWGENGEAARHCRLVPLERLPEGMVATAAPAAVAVAHPFAVEGNELHRALAAAGLVPPDSSRGTPSTDHLSLRLPADPLGPLPSERLSAVMGLDDTELPVQLASFTAPCVGIAPTDALPLLLRLDERDDHAVPSFGRALRYWCAAARFVVEVMREQRFVPTLVQERSGSLHAGWHPWLRDEAAAKRAA
ncbi:MAG: hypothetical protein KDA22_03330, partial [Phycisphaerales bacterium]|nr:hypothetical protein [Phycisphaerales bacterium]